jgi:putative endonuclease
MSAAGTQHPERRSPKDGAAEGSRMWHVYIIKCGNGSLYTGITNNLKRRFREHAAGKGGHYTMSFGAVKLLYFEKCSDKSSALKREARIKSWPRREKLALIKGDLQFLEEL